MESLSITLGIVLFVWGAVWYVVRLRQEKINEDRERRLKAFQEEIDKGFGLSQDLVLQGVSTPTIKQNTPPLTNPSPPPKASLPKPKQVSLEFKEYLQERYQKLGYTIWKKSENKFGIDIIAKQAKELLLIRCIYSTKKEAYRLYLNDFKAFRADANDFIELNPPFSHYEPSLLLILSDEILDEETKTYIKELQSRGKKIDYKVIPY